MKILLITDGIYPFVMGGMQKHSYYLAKILAQKHQLTLVHTASKKIEAKQVHLALGAHSKNLEVLFIESQTKDNLPGHYVRSSKKYAQKVYQHLKKELEENEYDLIYTKGLAGLSVLKNKMGSTPIIFNAHGYEMFQRAMGIKSILEQFLLRPLFSRQLKQADYVVSYGAKITDLLLSLKLKPSKIIELPGAIEQKIIIKQAYQANKPVRFVFLGRYEKRKGIDLLNKALKRCLKEGVRFQFDFIGPIPIEKQLQHQCIHYHGKISDFNKIQTLFTQSDVLVTPSLSEGMPNVIMEAMASGLAVVCSNVGASALLVNSENGALIEHVTAERVYQQIKVFTNIENHKLESMKQASLNKIKRFTWEKIKTKTLKTLEGLIDG